MGAYAQKDFQLQSVTNILEVFIYLFHVLLRIIILTITINQTKNSQILTLNYFNLIFVYIGLSDDQLGTF